MQIQSLIQTDTIFATTTTGTLTFRRSLRSVSTPSMQMQILYHCHWDRHFFFEPRAVTYLLYFNTFFCKQLLKKEETSIWEQTFSLLRETFSSKCAMFVLLPKCTDTFCWLWHKSIVSKQGQSSADTFRLAWKCLNGKFSFCCSEESVFCCTVLFLVFAGGECMYV